MSGWIALHRGWRDCDAFDENEPMSQREAWVWLIENAAWKKTYRRSPKGERIEVGRGQYHTSLRTLGEAFGWGKNKVARYLDKLVLNGMVGTVAGQSGLLITICNYEKYQDISDPNEVVSGTVAGQSRDTQEQRKQDSASNEAGVPPVDTSKALWDLGIELLTASGHDERAARSIVGRWRKGRTDGDVLAAIIDCQAKRISNPVEWMPKRLSQATPSPTAFTDHVLDKYRKAA